MARALPPRAARDRAPAWRAGRRADERSARRRRRRRRGALQAGRGLAAGKPVRARRARRTPAPARRRLADAKPHLRGRRPRGDVAVAGRNRAVGKRPGDAAELPRQPARHRFQPEQQRAGYAVGSSPIAGEDGVLLRYGKTWTQEPEEAIPPQARGASFTSVAFAGSEAIVAYRRRPNISQNQRDGWPARQRRLGWQVDARSRRGDRDGGAGGGRGAARRGRGVHDRRRRGRAARVSSAKRPARRGRPPPRRCRDRPRARWRCSAKAARCGRSSRPAGSATKANRSRRRPGFRRACSNPSRRSPAARKAAACYARPRAAGATRATN